VSRKNLVIVLLFAIVVAASYASAVPEMINFQGKLRNSTGSVLNGDYTINFTIYDYAIRGEKN